VSPDSLLAVSLGAHLLLLAGTMWSIARPARRLWPPPGRDSWQFGATWLLFAAATASLVWLGLADWNALGLSPWLRLPAGGLLLGGGLTLSLWGVASLGVGQALGLEGELRVSGPYRFSRNPQYVGDIAATLGWAVLTGSPRVGAVALVATLWYAVLPASEEPWLEERFGEEYRRYRRRVPRFFPD